LILPKAFGKVEVIFRTPCYCSTLLLMGKISLTLLPPARALRAYNTRLVTSDPEGAQSKQLSTIRCFAGLFPLFPLCTGEVSAWHKVTFGCLDKQMARAFGVELLREWGERGAGRG
jgi:hypothetical protein